MLLECRAVATESIDFSSCWNLHPWELYTLSSDLSASLSRVGILHPPILLARGDDRFEIVAGFKRLLFASSMLEGPQVACLVLAQDTQPAVILEVALADQALARPLSIVEKTRFCQICSRYLQQGEIVDRFGDRVMPDKRPSALAATAAILNQHPSILSAAHSGAVQEKMMLELLRLPSETDRLAMVRLFTELSMGDGKQRKFLPLIRDLAFGKGMSIAAYLENQAIQEILEHQAMNNPQKIQHLGSYLQQQANPLLTAAETAFAHEVRSLKMPDNCTITPSVAFEKDEVTLAMTFKNLSACKKWLASRKDALTLVS